MSANACAALGPLFARAALAVLAALLAACHTISAPRPTDLDRPNFLILMPDSFRADRVLTQRAGQPLAPNLAALAGRNACFERAVSQAGWTMPALATALTGRYPVLPAAGARKLGWLDPQRRSFPTILSLYGYHSWGFLGANLASLQDSVGTRFDELVGAEGPVPVVPGVTRELVEWLESRPEEPFLAFVHDLDLQFVADVAELSRYPGARERCPELGNDRSGRTSIAVGELQRCIKSGSKSDDPALAVAAAYDDAVASYDHALGEILVALERTGLAERTVLVFTSPHGHHLGENGRFGHGTLNEPDLHIPLLWVDPALPEPRQVTEQVVQLLDLAPSILARAGATLDAEMQGQSLLPLLGLSQGSYEPRDVFSVNDKRNMALRWGSQKMVRFNPGRGGRTMQQGQDRYLLFDLDEDPLETNNLMELAPPESVEALRQRLDSFHDQIVAESRAAAPGADAEPNRALRKRLHDHGYWRHVDPDGEERPPPPPGHGKGQRRR